MWGSFQMFCHQDVYITSFVALQGHYGFLRCNVKRKGCTIFDFSDQRYVTGGLCLTRVCVVLSGMGSSQGGKVHIPDSSQVFYEQFVLID